MNLISLSDDDYFEDSSVGSIAKVISIFVSLFSDITYNIYF